MKENLKRISLLLIPLLLIAAYAMMEEEWRIGELVVEKADLPWLPRFELFAASDTLSVAVPDTVAIAAEEQPVQPLQPRWQTHMEQRGDTLPRVLLFGDSMNEGLTRRLGDYCYATGYEMTSVIWYSSTSEIWSKTDTLEHFLRRVDPDYIMVCLCANELFVRNLKQRNEYIADIVRRLSDYDFIWISPPNWKEDTGINELIINNVGRDRYFDSRHLTLARCKDGAHPTFQAAEGWFDLVVQWMRSDSCATPLPMPEPPVSKAKKRTYHQYLLQPFKGKL